MSDGSYRYRVFGLRVASNLELPELLTDPAHNVAPDVEVISRTQLDVPVQNSLQAVDGGVRISIAGAGHYIVTKGQRIEVRSEPGAPERNVRLFLLGSAMGLLLHQRGLLPLHANAIEIDGQAVAFMGESRAGKSTLAAWFHDQGHRIIADDVCVVEFDEDGHALAQPGIPRFRLWRQSLEAAGRSAQGLQRSYVGDEDYDKWDVPVEQDRRCSGSTRLSAICILSRGDEPSLRRLNGVEAIEQLFAHTYRGEYTDPASTATDHWRQCLRLLGEVPIFIARRIWSLDEMNKQNEELLDMLRTQSSPLSAASSPPNE